MTRLLLTVPTFVFALAVSGPTWAINWGAVADEAQITVITTNEDGSQRETTIWLVVLDGEGYIRTSRTRWGRNMERDPNLVLRIAGTEHPLRAERVLDEGLHERVKSRFREKYGFWDRFTGLMRGLMGGGKIYHVMPRPN
jgi:hypothetical protein